jgi:hypothetical protein
MIYFFKKSLNWGPKAAGKVLGNALQITKDRVICPTSPPPNHSCIIINWGVGINYNNLSSGWLKHYWINHPDSVKVSANKILMTEAFKATSLPHLRSVSPKELDPDTMVVSRTLLSSHSGNGIVISRAADVPAAGLYTCLENFTTEQRLFVVLGEVVDVVEKRKMGKEKREKYGIEQVHPYIKSLKHGWIYARNGIQTTERARELAVSAMRAVGLDFGCVDIAWNSVDNPVIIETNSSPGLRNQETVDKFSTAIREKFLL